MLEHTKIHHTSNKFIYFNQGDKRYAIPKSIANRYAVKTDKLRPSGIPAEVVFAHLVKEITEAGALLKGLRTRENLSQEEFSKIIQVTQANLSKMENGKRPIGKIIAKRIAEKFNLDYRIFLG